MNVTPEIVLIDKPKGMTSRRALVHLKAHFDDRSLKLGHAGTLDPNASGLLVVGVGAGTKRLKEYVGLPKTYEAEILLGTKTDSGDITGMVIEKRGVSCTSKEQVADTLESMTGVLRLPVSAFSAMKKGGEPFYRKAHRGDDVGTLPLRDMQVHAAIYRSMTQVDGECVVAVAFIVETGVYIRSLAEEFGRRLGLPATLKNLRRTAVGDFRVVDSGVIRLEPDTEQ